MHHQPLVPNEQGGEFDELEDQVFSGLPRYHEPNLSRGPRTVIMLAARFADKPRLPVVEDDAERVGQVEHVVASVDGASLWVAEQAGPLCAYAACGCGTQNGCNFLLASR